MLHFLKRCYKFYSVTTMTVKGDWTSRNKTYLACLFDTFLFKKSFIYTLLINLDWNIKEILVLHFCDFLSFCFAFGRKKGVCLLSSFSCLLFKVKTVCRDQIYSHAGSAFWMVRICSLTTIQFTRLDRWSLKHFYLRSAKNYTMLYLSHL